MAFSSSPFWLNFGMTRRTAVGNHLHVDILPGRQEPEDTTLALLYKLYQTLSSIETMNDHREKGIYQKERLLG